MSVQIEGVGLFEFHISPKSRVEQTECGLGVVAHEQILGGEIVEVAPCYLLDATEARNSFTDDYCYISGEFIIVPFGWAGLYNHSYSPNVFHEVFADQRAIAFCANQVIEPGQQLLINYGEGYWAGLDAPKANPQRSISTLI